MADIEGVRFSINKRSAARWMMGDRQVPAGEYPIDRIDADLAKLQELAARYGSGPPVLELDADVWHLHIVNEKTREVLRTYCTMPGCATTAACWACVGRRTVPHPLTDTSRWTIESGDTRYVRAHTWLPDDVGTPIYDALEDAFAMTYGWRPGDA